MNQMTNPRRAIMDKMTAELSSVVFVWLVDVELLVWIALQMEHLFVVGFQVYWYNVEIGQSF